LPVLASDDGGTIVLANRAALDFFAGHGAVLGCGLRQLFPNLPARLPEGAGCSFEHRLADRRFTADLRPMGKDSNSRGWLIAVTGHEAPASEH
jgi:hypothetical protein